LQRSADEVVSGNGPGAVARYMRDILSLPRIPPERMGRRRMRLGTLSTGEPLDLAIRGRNFLIGGDPKSGKSWMAGSLCEQLILQRYSLCILDPEGDYACLEALPGVIVQPVGGKEALFRGLEQVLTHPDLSLVVDMSTAPRDEKPLLVRQLLEALNRLRRATGLPHRVVVDEAHYFLNQLKDPALFDHELGGYLLVTYRISDLSPDILRASEAVIVTRVDDRRQALALLALAPGAGTLSEWIALLADLAIDEAVLLPGTLETGGSLKRFRVAPRLTAHVRHRLKYADVPVGIEKEFVFTQDGRPTGGVLEPFGTCSRRCRSCPTMWYKAISLAGTFAAGSRASSATVSLARRSCASSGGTTRMYETPSGAPSRIGTAGAQHEGFTRGVDAKQG
jgi:hypothetical protein